MYRIYQGDCLDIMPKLKEESIDLILCDLPYGTSACKWDVVIPFEDMWKEYERVIKKEGAIVLFGSEPFSSALRQSNPKLYKYDWKWEKPNGANFLNSKYQPLKTYEDIMVFGKGATSYSKGIHMKYNPQMEVGTPYKQVSGKQKSQYGNSSVRTPIKQVKTINNGERYPRSILRFAPDKEKLHPTQKPVELLKYLIKTYTDEGDLVLDNCMGSGSTIIAAEQLKRKSIGIEIDSNYYNIAKQRLQEL